MEFGFLFRLFIFAIKTPKNQDKNKKKTIATSFSTYTAVYQAIEQRAFERKSTSNNSVVKYNLQT